MEPFLKFCLFVLWALGVGKLFLTGSVALGVVAFIIFPIGIIVGVCTIFGVM